MTSPRTPARTATRGRTGPAKPTGGLRHLVLVLGDQLDADATAFEDFDPSTDMAWMAEVAEESTHVWSTKMRIALFLSAMRHFAEAIAESGRPLRYVRLDHPDNTQTLAGELARAIADLRPERLVMTAPGDWRVLQALRGTAQAAGLPLDIRDDRTFFAAVRDFAAFAREVRGIRLETWYRRLRKRHAVLMDGDQPAGGRWNFDTENRKAFGRKGPGDLPQRPAVEPDAITREVLALVSDRFADHPGSLDRFDWPVTPAQATLALDRFVAERLPAFGRYQDAMWEGDVWLLHSQLSSSMNLKLLDPRAVVAAAEAAYRSGAAPIESVEGFVRQVLGWREYVRGIYWTEMPGYLEVNALEAHEPLPAWYWTGDVRMACLADALEQTLTRGYAHHIQRLMVTGLYAMLLGVEPKQIHGWYLSVYVDAVEWVELPNVLGLSQHADGGLAGSKPYAASGRYIDRMSNHCAGCPFEPGERTGERACPFTTLYWDFLGRHAERLAGNRRMQWQVSSLERMPTDERRAIAERAAAIRRGEVGVPSPA